MEFRYLGALFAYIVVTVVLGWYAGRRRTVEGYLIGGRRLGAVQSGFSILASKIGGGMVLVLTAYVYAFGFSAVTYLLGAGVGYTCFLFFARRMKRTADSQRFYTLMDFLSHKYGTSNLQWLTLLFLFANLASFVIQVIGGGKIIASIFGLSYWLSVCIMMAAILIYLTIGGFKAVVYTDVFQGILFVVLLVVIVVFLGGQGGTAPVFDAMSPLLMVSFFVAGLFWPFAQIDLWQRVYATRRKSLTSGLAIGLVGYLVAGGLLVALAFFIKTVLPGMQPENAVIEAFRTQLSGALGAIGLVALFAIIMSTADTWLFSCSAVLLQDFLRVRKPHRHFKYAFLFIGGLSIVTAILFPDMIDITFIYATAFLTIGSLVVYGLFFRFKKERMGVAYVVMTVLYVGLVVVSGLELTYLIAALFIVPISYFVSWGVGVLRRLRVVAEEC